jgi:hypothetical protein
MRIASLKPESAVTLPALALGLIVLAAGTVNAQKEPADNTLRPLDALGMTYAALSSHLGPCKSECRQHEKEAKQGYRATFEVPPYSYTVEGGKVVEVMITADSFEGFVAEAKEKWGQPTSLTYQILADQDGTEARYGVAHWDLPGGVVADARQIPVPGKVIGVTKLHLGGPPVLLTQKEPATEGALVIISNPSSQRTEKPKPRPLL